MATTKNKRLMLKGIKIDERTEDYINKKIQSISKLLTKVLRTEAEISMDKKGKFRVEVMVHAPHVLYRAEETSVSIEGSVDIVEDEIKSQIRRDKDKQVTLRRRGGRSIKKKVVIDKSARF